MVNIFIFSPVSLEYGRGGEIYSMDLAAGLQKYYNTTLFHTNLYYADKFLNKHETIKKLKERGFKFKKIQRMNFATIDIFNRQFSFPHPLDIIRLHKKIKKNDVVYLSVSNVKNNLIFMLLYLLNPRVKFILGYHRPLHSEKFLSLYNLKYRLSILLLSLFKKRFYHQTISQHAKIFLENFYVSKKVFHIVEGLEIEKFFNEEFEKKVNPNLIIMYAGALNDEHKGIGVLLKAIEGFIEKHNELRVKFEIYGFGPLEEETKDLIRRFPQYLKLFGYIDYKDLVEAFKNCDVFISSSRREPFGRVIIEALAGKSIIISTKTFGAIDILTGKDFAFFLEELSENEIMEKILKVYRLWLENPEKFKRLQNSASKYVFQTYTISKEIEMFKDFIDKLIKNKI